MHESILKFLETHILPSDIIGKRVLILGDCEQISLIKEIVKSKSPLLCMVVDDKKTKNVDQRVQLALLSRRFNTGFMEVVICCEVIQRREDWREVMRQMKSILAPAGLIYLTTRSLGVKFDKTAGDAQRFSLDHIYRAFRDTNIRYISEDPQKPGVFIKAEIPIKKLPPVDLDRIVPDQVYSPTHYKSILCERLPQDIKFTIITPTLLRPTLARTCKSIDTQMYKNIEHIVMVDTPGGGQIGEDKPYRKWVMCQKPHKDSGNTCRKNALEIATGDYVLYLDDDNYYLGESLSILNGLLREKPNWGVFPMWYLGQRLESIPKEGKSIVDANQFFHKRIIAGKKIVYPNFDKYSADSELLKILNSCGSPVLLDPECDLVSADTRSFGRAPDNRQFRDRFAVIIPNRYEDIILPLMESMEDFQERPKRVVIIGDGHNRDYGFECIRSPFDRFIFSRNINLGFQHTDPLDVIICNDDIRLIHFDTFTGLAEVAYSDPAIGIVAPMVDGVSSPMARMDRVDELWAKNAEIYFAKGTSEDYLAFPCVYIKRQVIDEVGQMDERFTEYGRDDCDFCVRAAKLGWKLAITRSVTVQHGSGGAANKRGANYSCSFARRQPDQTGPALLAGDFFRKKYEGVK